MNHSKPTRFFPVTELLPHTGSALLLDRLLGYGNDWIESEVHHEQHSLYTDSDGNVPSWVGIEYMVQTIGLFAGLEAKHQNKAVTPGLLVGTRSFSSHVDFFPAKSIIKIRAELRFRDENNMVMFACTIFDNKNSILADAEIKAIQPENAHEILKELMYA